MIKAAITKRGFIWILLIGATNGSIKLATTGTFASKNDLRILIVTVRPFAHDVHYFAIHVHLHEAT